MKIDLKKKIVKASKWVSIGFFVKIILQLSVSVLLVRLIEPDVLGDFYLLNSIISFGVIFCSLGLSNSLLRTVSNWIYNGEVTVLQEWFRRILFWVICSVFIISIALFFSLPFFFKDFLKSSYASFTSVIIILWLIASVFQTLFKSWVLAFQNQQAIALYFEILPQVLMLTALLIGAVYNFQFLLNVIIALLFLVTIISGAVLYQEYHRGIKVMKSSIFHDSGSSDKEHLSTKSIFKVAFPLWVIGIMLFVLTRFDIWIIGFALSSEDVAIYGTVLKLTAILGILFGVFNSVIAPLISELFIKKELLELEKIIRTAATFSTIPALIFTLIFFFYGGEILAALFGELFIKGEVVLRILTVGIGVNILTGCCGILLMYTDYQKIMMIITIVSGSLTMFLSYYLVKSYGMEGVAYASSGGMIFQNIFMFYFARKKVGIKTHFNFQYLKRDNFKLLFKLKNS